MLIQVQYYKLVVIARFREAITLKMQLIMINIINGSDPKWLEKTKAMCYHLPIFQYTLQMIPVLASGCVIFSVLKRYVQMMTVFPLKRKTQPRNNIDKNEK